MKYKLPEGATNRAIVDDIELEIGGEAQELSTDQIERLKDVGVEVELDNKESSNG